VPYIRLKINFACVHALPDVAGKKIASNKPPVGKLDKGTNAVHGGHSIKEWAPTLHYIYV
jgi:hypothetical protein